MDTSNCEAGESSNEGQWFRNNIASVFANRRWLLLSSQGELASEAFTAEPALLEAARQVLAGRDVQARDRQQPLYLAASTAQCDAFWLLPLGDAAKDYEALVLPAGESALDESEVTAKYYQLLYRLKEKQCQVLQARLNDAEQWIQDELDEIARIQQLMLPDKDLQLPGADLAFTYKAMKGAGGDYLEIADLSRVTPNGEQDIGIIVADVSGHGPAAAVEAAMIDAILRTFAPVDPSSANSEVLSYINKHFFTRKGRGSFLTAMVTRYSEVEQCLFYANAGHPHAYLKKADQLITLDQGGIPIGVLKEQEWQTHKVDVDKGDTLFIYTDVVVETKNKQGEQFGFERLSKALSIASHAPEQLLAQLEAEMNAFCGCTKYQDDLTMCAIQFK